MMIFYVSGSMFRGYSADEVASLGGNPWHVTRLFADWSIQTVHVDDLVNCKVLVQSRVACGRRVFLAELAVSFHAVVDAVGYHCVILARRSRSCLFGLCRRPTRRSQSEQRNWACIIVSCMFVVFQRRTWEPNHETLQVDVILLRNVFVFVENFLGELRYVVPWIG